MAFERAVRGLIDLVPGLPAQLTKHYSLFREPATRSTTMKLLEQGHLLSSQNVGVMGLDLAQARTFKLGRGLTLFVVPGSAGVCLDLRIGSGGLGSCHPGPSAWEQGTIGLGGGGDFQGVMTFYVVALVPDSNRTVSVGLSNGQTVVLPVKHNIVVRGFAVEPTKITYRNAAGKLTTYG